MAQLVKAVLLCLHLQVQSTYFSTASLAPCLRPFASRAEDPGFESCLEWDFSGPSHTSDSKIGSPASTLPGAWRYRVSTGTGWPGVSML